MSLDQYPDWPDLQRWLNVLKDRVETLPSISAEQVITGTFDPSLIPPIPWDDVLKAGSSLGDLETRSAADLSSGTLPDARMPGLTGDVSSVAGTVVMTLATVNTNPGAYGSGSTIPVITVNQKGLVTNVIEQPIQTGELTRVNDTNVTVTLGGSPSTALLKDVSLTLGWTGTLGVTRGGTGTGTAFTAGSVVFAGASGVYSQDNANLFWDDTNNRLGVGTSTPGATIDVAHSSNGNIISRFDSTHYCTFDISSGGDFNASCTPDTGSAYTFNSARTVAMFFLNNSSTRGPQMEFRKSGSRNGSIGVDGSYLNTTATNFGIFAQTNLVFYTNFSGAESMRLDTSGRLGIGVTTVTAKLHLAAGTATASTAPLKFTSGTLLTTAEVGAIEFLGDVYYGTITTGAARKTFAFLESPAFTTPDIGAATGASLAITGAVGKYKNVNTAGWGLPAIYGTGRSTAQVAAVASVATYTVGAADGSFHVSANVNVTTSTTHSFSVQVDYTDETNTAQTLTLTFSQLTAALVSVITNVTGAGPYEGLPVQIRCKASTAITVKTTGTFTTVTYNVEGLIQQVS